MWQIKSLTSGKRSVMSTLRIDLKYLLFGLWIILDMSGIVLFCTIFEHMPCIESWLIPYDNWAHANTTIALAIVPRTKRFNFIFVLFCFTYANELSVEYAGVDFFLSPNMKSLSYLGIENTYEKYRTDSLSSRMSLLLWKECGKRRRSNSNSKEKTPHFVYFGKVTLFHIQLMLYN